MEKRVAEELGRCGVGFEFERTSFAYTLKKSYTPDFFLSNGVIVETKGWFKSSDRTKLLAVKLANPSLDIRLVFQNSKARLSKASKTNYGEWATKNKIPWADTSIPLEWTK